jgi:8-amino-7-oxononanoate synthase
MSGDLALHHHLEERVAAFKAKEAALVYPTGYQANIGILSSLVGRGDCVFLDRLSHASIVDGALLSGARIFRFRHNDPDHLEHLLKRERTSFKKALLVTETIFSMDGDRCPLKELVALKEKYGLLLMVDEAHATGVFGKRGSGVVEEEGLEEEVDLIMGTFGKALGGFGAYVASSKRLIHYLINTSRSFIYSTALPPPILGANLAALDIIEKEPHRREELLRRVESFRKSLTQNGLNVRGSSQIVPIIIGGVDRVRSFSELLRKGGYWALPIRPPTVPKGEERVRLSISLLHSRETLDGVMKKILEAKEVLLDSY